MISLNFETPPEIARRLAKQFKERRLSLNLTQKMVAERSGSSLAVLKQFEQTGKISLISLLKIAAVLGALEPFGQLFKTGPLENVLSLDDLIRAPKIRQRARGK